MRLTQDEVVAIRACARRHFGNDCRIHLFGSRVDDSRIGGDIDLHVEATSDEEAALTRELAFRLDLADLIGDQRIDIILRPPRYIPRAIDLIARQTGIALG